MADAAGGSHQHHSHKPSFSAPHPMIPRLYVMPWKQDMKNQRLLRKNADLAGVPVVPLEESLWLRGRERLCHGQDPASRSASSAPLSQTGLMAPHSSHFSRYNSSAVTVKQLYQPEHTPRTHTPKQFTCSPLGVSVCACEPSTAASAQAAGGDEAMKTSE